MKDFTQFIYHIQYEPQFDEVPVIRVYENYLDFDGEQHTDFEQIVDRYEFTAQDVAYALVGFDNTRDITDLVIDEYYTVNMFGKNTWWLSPEIVAWVEDQYEAGIRELLKEIV